MEEKMEANDTEVLERDVSVDLEETEMAWHTTPIQGLIIILP